MAVGKYLIFSFIPFIASLIFLTGCSGILDQSNGDIHPIDDTILFSIVDSIELSSWTGPRDWILGMSTETIYPCCNWSLEHYIERDHSCITVNLLGVYEPDICLSALGPAGSSSALGISNGAYVLTFAYDGMYDDYSVTVSDSGVVITEVDATFTQPQPES